MNNSAIGRDALEFMKSILTPEEIEESKRRVALMGKHIEARQKTKDIKMNEDDVAKHETAMAEYYAGEAVPHEAIDWD